MKEIFSPKAIRIFLLLGFVSTWAGGATFAQKSDAQPNAAGDLSGTYTGSVNYPSSGLTGDATLTIAEDKFTLTSGSAVFTGTISNVRSRGYLSVMLQFGATTPPNGGQAATPPTAMVVRLRRDGDKLTFTSVNSKPEGKRRNRPRRGTGI